MRLRVIALVGLLCVVAQPAFATSITIRFEGAITNASPQVGVFTPPDIGTAFTIDVLFGEALESETVINFAAGEYNSIYTFCRECRDEDVAYAQAAGLYPLGIYGFGADWVTNSLYLTLDEGWQSGTMAITFERAQGGMGLGGTITGSHAVPEPATWLLSLAGIIGIRAASVARRRSTDTPRFRR